MDLIDIAFLDELSKLGFGSFEQTKRKVIERTIKPPKEIKKGRVNPRSIYSSKQNPIRDITIDEPGGWMEGLKEEARKKRSGPAGKGLKWMEVEGKTSEGAFLDELSKIAAPPKFKRPKQLKIDPHPWARRATSRKMQALLGLPSGAVVGGIGGGLIGSLGGPGGTLPGAAIGVPVGAGLGAADALVGTTIERAVHARGTLGRLRRGGHSLTKPEVKLLGEAAGMSERQVRGAIKKMTAQATKKGKKTYPVSRFVTSRFDEPEAFHHGETAERLFSSKALKSRSLTGRKLMKSEEKLLAELQKHKPASIKKIVGAVATPVAAAAGLPALLRGMRRLTGAKDEKGHKKAASPKCSDCDKPINVNFPIREDRPPLCRECFNKRRLGHGHKKAAEAKKDEKKDPTIWAKVRAGMAKAKA